MRVAINQLGLAAFVKMNGATLESVEGRTFVFESEVPVQEWRTRYMNSCCMKHDTILCELRHYLRAEPV